MSRKTTIEINVPHFCPDNCKHLEVSEEITEFQLSEDGEAYRPVLQRTCRNEGHCRTLYNYLETRYCDKCMKEKEKWNRRAEE